MTKAQNVTKGDIFPGSPQEKPAERATAPTAPEYGISYEKLDELVRGAALSHRAAGGRASMVLAVRGIKRGRTVQLRPGLRARIIGHNTEQTIVRLYADDARRWLDAEARKGRWKPSDAAQSSGPTAAEPAEVAPPLVTPEDHPAESQRRTCPTCGAAPDDDDPFVISHDLQKHVAAGVRIGDFSVDKLRAAGAHKPGGTP